MTTPALAVVLPTRNPDRARLAEVLAALRVQVPPAGGFELCVVDNGSSPPLTALEVAAGGTVQLLTEPRAGLIDARLRGVSATTAPLLVFMDDDTVPARDYLVQAAAFMDAHPRMATAGGRIHPRFLAPPPDWLPDFTWALAVRDHGPVPLEWSAQSGDPLPVWTPIGAGLVARRAALVPGYVRHLERNRAAVERRSWRGPPLGGVEDKDLVLQTLRAGWTTGYTPSLSLTHVLPASRLQFAYLDTLVPSLQSLWAQTLHAHGFDLHRPVSPATLPFRRAKAWFVFRSWRSPAHRLRWRSTCGYLEGLAAVFRAPDRYASEPDPH